MKKPWSKHLFPASGQNRMRPPIQLSSLCLYELSREENKYITFFPPQGFTGLKQHKTHVILQTAKSCDGKETNWKVQSSWHLVPNFCQLRLKMLLFAFKMVSRSTDILVGTKIVF